MALRQALENIKDEKQLVGAEIGVLRGDYAKEIVENLDIEKLFLIDPYECFQGYDDFSTHQLQEAKEEAKDKLDPYSNKIRWIESFSDQAWVKIPVSMLDFVYIDGCHQTPFAFTDIAIYTQLVKEGGLVSGHDYRQHLQGRVADAVNMYCQTHDIDLKFDHADWWFWK